MKIITRKEAERLINAGTEILPTSWVDVDKNSGLTETVREGGKTITRPAAPKYTSRLVAQGDLQKQFGRTDSPTADPEAIALVCAFAVSEGA